MINSESVSFEEWKELKLENINSYHVRFDGEKQKVFYRKTNDYFKNIMDWILKKVNTKYGAPLGRRDIGKFPTDSNIKIYDRIVVLDRQGYDKGGAYWGLGPQLRVSFTKDLSYVHFYRID